MYRQIIARRILKHAGKPSWWYKDIVAAGLGSCQKLRLATGILTGHSQLNRHLSVMGIICDPTCNYCEEGLETAAHFQRECSHFVTLRLATKTLICVLVSRPRWCLTLSNPVPWQNWMAAYLGYTLRMKTLFRGWPVMVHDTHTRRRRLRQEIWGKTYLCPSEADSVQNLVRFIQKSHRFSLGMWQSQLKSASVGCRFYRSKSVGCGFGCGFVGARSKYNLIP